MDEEEHLSAEALRRLEALGVEPESLDARTRGQVRRLEEAAEREAAERTAALEEAASHNLSVSSLAQASGISRATFYNKDVLRRYAELCRAELAPPRRAEEKRLRGLLADARREIGLLRRRDGELVLAKADNERLKERVAALEAALRERDGGHTSGGGGANLTVIS